MSVGRLVAGVAGLNSVYLVVGYCLLTPFLRRPRDGIRTPAGAKEGT